MEGLCRICLSNETKYPVFGSDAVARDIFSKISKCLDAKLEDVEGYPRKICSQCNDMLNFVSEFIDKFKQTCEILYHGIDLKIENIKEEEIFPENISDKEEIFPGNVSGEEEKYDCLTYFDNSLDKNSVDDDAESRVTTQNEHNTNMSNNKKVCRKKKNRKRCKPIKTLPCKKRVKIIKERDLSNKTQRTEVRNFPKLCDLCGEVFENKDKFYNHTRKYHQKVRFKCAACDKSYRTPSGRKRHYLEKHTELQTYKCSSCSLGFALKISLARHIIRVHENKVIRKRKKFACNLCKKQFCENKSLIIHERSTHTGERPAMCNVCDARFFHEDYLKEHMRLHTGEAPFKCLVCGKGHTQRGNMKSHLRVHRLSELDPDVRKKLRPTMLKYFKKE